MTNGVRVVFSYVSDLSAKKQDKALIHAKRARNIKTVLADPKDTAVESAQFRYAIYFHRLQYASSLQLGLRVDDQLS